MIVAARERVLVVDDEVPQLRILEAILRKEGLEVETATSAEAASRQLHAVAPAVVLTDLKLPGRADGIDLLEEIGRVAPQACVILMTAHGSIDNAVEAMKKGAFDYLTKPLERETVVFTVQRALEKSRLLRGTLDLHRTPDRFSMENLIGDHGSMQEVFRTVLKIAPSASSVLILGESGTGKELVARAVHHYSPRALLPFHAINCAAIPEPLLEDELFGHERGAFTGATARRIGLFEVASGGTLFLDEIGDMSLSTQAKLLRAVQEREIRRIGGTQMIRIDPRIVAATNRDLGALMREGLFREDLYYRLSVVIVTMPPLRERASDIPRLASHFLQRHAAAERKNVVGIEDDAMAVLCRHAWPGNVRQLESAIERAVLMTDGPRLTIADLPLEIQRPESMDAALSVEIPDGGVSFEAIEKDLLEKALEKMQGNVSRAARLLGLTRRTFQYRLKKFGLARPAHPGWSESEGDEDDTDR